MIAENAERLRSQIGELENELLNKSSAKTDMASGGSSAHASTSGQDDSSDDRAAVMQGLLKELRAELIHKEEVCVRLCVLLCPVELLAILHDQLR